MNLTDTVFRNARRMALGSGGAASGNVGENERLASLVAGSALTGYGLGKGTPGGLVIALFGGALVVRGATGHCAAYKYFGRDSTSNEHNRDASVPYGTGIRVEKSMFIACSPDEVYSFWRDLENLPQFMSHVQSVSVLDEKTSHWVARAPAGKTVEWNAEIINDIPGELLAWRSLPGADVPNAGSVRFMGTGDSTNVQVELEYRPPAGVLGAAVARLFGEEPGQQVAEDLYRLKEILETPIDAVM